MKRNREPPVFRALIQFSSKGLDIYAEYLPDGRCWVLPNGAKWYVYELEKKPHVQLGPLVAKRIDRLPPARHTGISADKTDYAAWWDAIKKAT
jgi:hypothetical protein